ncbi:hypothetical protein LEMLEM_LOCUS15365, partial [Lemmus lemmus]
MVEHLCLYEPASPFHIVNKLWDIPDFRTRIAWPINLIIVKMAKVKTHEEGLTCLNG